MPSLKLVTFLPSCSFFFFFACVCAEFISFPPHLIPPLPAGCHCLAGGTEILHWLLELSLFVAQTKCAAYFEEPNLHSSTHTHTRTNTASLPHSIWHTKIAARLIDFHFELWVFSSQIFCWVIEMFSIRNRWKIF